MNNEHNTAKAIGFGLGVALGAVAMGSLLGYIGKKLEGR